jgi:N-acetylglucosamine kinase-like BadF-type ATPase
MAGASIPQLKASSFSMAGADWIEDYQFLRETFENCGFSNITLVNDAIGGLRAGSRTGMGVSIVCGTGAAIGAVGNQGQMWHGSFWIRGLWSEDIVKEIYDSVIKAELGIGEPTNLAKRVLEIYQKDNIEAWLFDITSRNGSRRKESKNIIKAMMQEADNNDPCANKILEKYAFGCADYALAAAKKVSFQENDLFDFVYTGGWFRHPSILLNSMIKQKLEPKYMYASHIISPVEPVIGALYLSFDRLNITVSDTIVDRIKETGPDAVLFETM